MDLSPAHAEARLSAQRDAAIEASYEMLVAGGYPVTIDVHSGSRPPPGGPPGQDPRASLLVDADGSLDMENHRIILPTPFEALILLSGTATWARVLAGGGAWWADMDVSEFGGSAPLRLETTALVAGAFLRLNHAVFEG